MSVKVEDDMTYGVWSPEGHWHYPESLDPEEPKFFDLRKVKDLNVQRLITEESQLPRSELERRFRSLAKWTSMRDMQTSNLALVDHFLNGNNAEKLPFPDPSGTLTKNVFEHKSTKAFIEGIKKRLGEELRDSDYVPKSLDLSNSLGNVSAPEFSGVNYVTGLGFAIHLMYGYSVVASNIVCDWETGRYKATVDIEMTDHFGLDYGDVDKFGTTEKVLNKLKPNIVIPASIGVGLLLGAAVPFVYRLFNNRSKLDSYVHEYAAGAGIGSVAGITVSSVGYTGLAPIAKQVSEGFRAWFILQHYHGCRPFLTVMRKTIDIEGVIPKR